MISQRAYQQKAIDQTFEEWKDKRSTLVVMPTGTGKTVVFSGIISKMMPKRTMVIAHREELLFQAREKIHRVAGLECDIEKAELAASTNGFFRQPVVVASIQTLISGELEKKRVRRFDPMDFGCIVIDEAHRATAPSYRHVIKHFLEGNPDLKIFGCTATPDRTDEQALGQIFESVAFDYEILDAISDGWLVPIDQQMVSIDGLDFSHIKTTCGDLNGAELAAVMEMEKNMQGVAGASIQIIGTKRAIVFTSSVKQAEMVCSIFNRHREGMADWVCGTTDKEKRRDLLTQFKDGHIQVVCNCNCLSEGFDDPGVEVIVMARPTKSRSLYAQCCGRSMRPLPGVVDDLIDADARKAAIAASAKRSCLIVDFVGNSGKHKLMSTADILGGNVSDEVLERAVKRVQETQGSLRMVDVIAEEEDNLRKEEERRRKIAEDRKRKVVARVTYTSSRINPFDALDITPQRERGWDAGRTLSEKQRNLLAKQGLNPDELTFGQGKQIIAQLFHRWGDGLCSLKQAALLKRHGYETKTMKREEASRLITDLKANGWKRPQPQTL
jgi:superfamily II DNA or RNA helicase